MIIRATTRVRLIGRIAHITHTLRRTEEGTNRFEWQFMPQRGYDRFIVLHVSYIHLERQRKERIGLNDNPSQSQLGYDWFIVLNVSHIHLEGQKKKQIDLNDNPWHNDGTTDSSYWTYRIMENRLAIGWGKYKHSKRRRIQFHYCYWKQQTSNISIGLRTNTKLNVLIHKLFIIRHHWYHRYQYYYRKQNHYLLCFYQQYRQHSTMLSPMTQRVYDRFVVLNIWDNGKSIG